MLIDYLAPIAEDLRNILDEYINSPVSGTPILDPIPVRIIHGTEGFTKNCCPGEAWVRVDRVSPTVSPPNVTQRTACPTPFLLAAFEFGVARCACTPDDDGNPPDDECLEWEWQIASADRERLIQAIMCALCQEDYDVYMDSWIPEATDKCMGSTIQFFIPYRSHCDETF